MDAKQLARRGKNFNVVIAESSYDNGIVDINITTNGFQWQSLSLTPGECATVGYEISKFLTKYVGE